MSNRNKFKFNSLYKHKNNMENQYIQDLQNKYIELQDKIFKVIKILEENEQSWVCEECDSFDIAQNALQVLRGDLE